MSKKYASVTQIVAIHAELERVLVKHEDGTVFYTDGSSDRTVAAKYADLSPSHVGRIRREAFGELSKHKSPVEDRVSTLEAQMAIVLAALNIDKRD